MLKIVAIPDLSLIPVNNVIFLTEKGAGKTVQKNKIPLKATLKIIPWRLRCYK